MTDGNRRQTGFRRGPELAVNMGTGRQEVFLEAFRQGADWFLRVTGGDAHIGAAALAGGDEVWVKALGPHKEGPLAESCARRWSERTGTVCLVAAGIHQDNITRDEIEAILANVDAGLENLLDKWEGQRP